MTIEQGNEIIELLKGIAVRMDFLIAIAQTPEEPEGCQHPEDQRVNLSSMGDANHWVCTLCRFDNKATPLS